jgi:hypothetical protein
MTSQPIKPKRWRSRFSVRTLLILMTLVCAYLACWGPTKKLGGEEVRSVIDKDGFKVMTADAIAPLFVRTDESLLFVDGSSSFAAFDGSSSTIASANVIVSGPMMRRYHFWFFGYVAKLPYEQQIALDIYQGPVLPKSG